METPRQILVVIDPTSNRQPALARARQLALFFGATLQLFVCYTDSKHETQVDRRVIEGKLNRLRKSGIECSAELVSDRALHTGIIRKVLRSQPSLVIKDTHPHTLLRRSWLGNTDWQLIRLCPAPLLFVRPGPWGRPPRIAAAIDVAQPGEKPAQLDHSLLAAAETFALASGGELAPLRRLPPHRRRRLV